MRITEKLTIKIYIACHGKMPFLLVKHWFSLCILTFIIRLLGRVACFRNA